MSYTGQVSNFGYCTMGNGRSDYEGFYGVSMNRQHYGFHCHDFYEIYLHIYEGRQFGVDNEVYLLEPNQLIIIPPFRMHGLLWEESLPRYERAYMYCSTDFLAKAGCGQIDLVQLFVEQSKSSGCLIYPVSPEVANECKNLLSVLMAGTHFVADVSDGAVPDRPFHYEGYQSPAALRHRQPDDAPGTGVY